MNSFRAMRRLVSVSTAVLLLLCQTTVLAQVCMTTPTQDRPAAGTTMPCHGSADSANLLSQLPAAPSVCDASQTIPETANAPVFALAALPVLIIAARDVVTREGSGITQPAYTVCSSPPLTVLHCRYLI